MATFSPIKVPAVKGTANADAERVQIYTAEIPAPIVASFYVEQAALKEGGFQRQLDMRRAKQIGALMGGDRKRSVLPQVNIHSGLLAYADENEVEWQTKGGRVLLIKTPLRFIDGQHRGAGAREAVERGYAGEHPYTESVRIVVGLTHAEVALMFLRCNMEQRKVAPKTIIQDVAYMTGTVMRKKSWVCRLVVALAQDEPFMVEDLPLVAFGDKAPIQPMSLYRAIDILLPPELNVEGEEPEREAVVFAHKALTAYAEIFGDTWGALNAEKGFVEADLYGYTMLVAFAKVVTALREPGLSEEDLFEEAARIFELSGLNRGEIPGTFGSGERAASGLATWAASHAATEAKTKAA